VGGGGVARRHQRGARGGEPAGRRRRSGGGAHGQDEESERSEVEHDKGVGCLSEILNRLFCNFATVSVNSGRRE
jgi:hypothetical protein